MTIRDFVILCSYGIETIMIYDIDNEEELYYDVVDNLEDNDFLDYEIYSWDLDQRNGNPYICFNVVN